HLAPCRRALAVEPGSLRCVRRRPANDRSAAVRALLSAAGASVVRPLQFVTAARRFPPRKFMSAAWLTNTARPHDGAPPPDPEPLSRRRSASGHEKREWRRRTPRRGSSTPPLPVKMSGGELLSHTLPSAVPSARSSLASGFGMEPGVSSTL